MSRSPLSRTFLAILPILGALLTGVAASEAWPLPLSLLSMAAVASASAVIYWSAPLRPKALAPAQSSALLGIEAVAESSTPLPPAPPAEPGSIGTRAACLTGGERYESDLLTGLLAPDAFCSRVCVELDRCRASGQPAVLVLCDIDGFGAINRIAGLVEANTMLRQVADCLRLTVREGDVLARLGGDEFGIFFPGLLPEIAEHRVRDLRAAVREAGLLTLPDHAPQVTACVGTSCFPENGTDVATLLAFAEQTMAAAKRERQENADRPIASALLLSRD